MLNSFLGISLEICFNASQKTTSCRLQIVTGTRDNEEVQWSHTE